MGKTASEKRSAGPPPSGASDGADASDPAATPRASTTGEPGEPLERARLHAEVARQRVRIAKEELKRARKRVKEAKREAKRARKQAAVARKAWKKARKAHHARPAPEAAPAGHTRQPKALQSSAPARERKSTRRRLSRGTPKSHAEGSGPV